MTRSAGEMVACAVLVACIASCKRETRPAAPPAAPTVSAAKPPAPPRPSTKDEEKKKAWIEQAVQDSAGSGSPFLIPPPPAVTADYTKSATIARDGARAVGKIALLAVVRRSLGEATFVAQPCSNTELAALLRGSGDEPAEPFTVSFSPAQRKGVEAIATEESFGFDDIGQEQAVCSFVRLRITHATLDLAGELLTIY